jgi:transcriptional regulator with XRE-family HTH domain
LDTDLTPTIGKRLREMRKMRGLTVREQASLLQVSPSTLSELERGIAGISLQRLQSVAHSLGVSVSDLLTHDESPTNEARPLEISQPADLGATSIRRGRGVHYTLVGSHGEHTLQPYRIMFDAGAGYADDPIAHPGEEFVYVLFGDVHLHLGDQQHLLTTGSCARFDSGVPHAFSNASHSNVAGLIGAGTPPW